MRPAVAPTKKDVPRKPKEAATASSGSKPSTEASALSTLAFASHARAPAPTEDEAGERDEGSESTRVLKERLAELKRRRQEVERVLTDLDTEVSRSKEPRLDAAAAASASGDAATASPSIGTLTADTFLFFQSIFLPFIIFATV